MNETADCTPSLSLLRSFVCPASAPMAHAMGCNLSPLCGCGEVENSGIPTHDGAPSWVERLFVPSCGTVQFFFCLGQ